MQTQTEIFSETLIGDWPSLPGNCLVGVVKETKRVISILGPIIESAGIFPKWSDD